MEQNYLGRPTTKTVLELSLNDLKAVVSDVLQEERAHAAEEAEKAKGIDLLTRNEVCKLLNVSFSTLNRWEKMGYLTPVRAGRKVHYKKADVKSLLK